MKNVLWINDNIDNKEIQKYIKELELNVSISFKLFKNIEKAIEKLKEIKFEETKIIISDSLYSKFVKSFKENILKMYIAPKIIIFTKNKKNFIKLNKDYNKNEFYSQCGIAISLNEIKEFLENNKMNEIKKK